MLTRRHFLYGAAGVAAIAAVGGGAYAVASAGSSSGSSSVSVLTVPEDGVITTDDLTALDNADGCMVLQSSLELDYGTLVWATDDDVAACLTPTDTAQPLTKVGLIALASGTYVTALEHAVGEDEGFEVYDVRASSGGAVWTEANISKGMWRVYHAPLDGLSLGDAVLAQQGDANWEMPMVTAVGDYAFWQVIPRTDGTATREDSVLYRAKFGNTGAKEAYVSHGRMATAPSADAGGVVITPRTDTSSIHYQLTRLDADTLAVTDALALPASMKPLEASYGQTGFSFAFDGIYSYGGGIANLGTYAAAQGVAASDDPETAAAAYSGAPWFRYPRTPSAAPAWCGDYLIVKSTSAVCGVNLDAREYFALDVAEGCDSYGDYLASTGGRARIVTYSNIDYTTIAGEQITHCLVRVWQPVG